MDAVAKTHVLVLLAPENQGGNILEYSWIAVCSRKNDGSPAQFSREHKRYFGFSPSAT